MAYPIASTPRTVAESESLFERVKAHFWAPDEKDFIVRISDAPMAEWERIPTPTVEEMIGLRCRLIDSDQEFAGFVHQDGRYAFYFYDRNFLKTQLFNPFETVCFDINGFSEIDMKKVAAELRVLQGS